MSKLYASSTLSRARPSFSIARPSPLACCRIYGEISHCYSASRALVTMLKLPLSVGNARCDSPQPPEHVDWSVVPLRRTCFHAVDVGRAVLVLVLGLGWDKRCIAKTGGLGTPRRWAAVGPSSMSACASTFSGTFPPASHWPPRRRFLDTICSTVSLIAIVVLAATRSMNRHRHEFVLKCMCTIYIYDL